MIDIHSHIIQGVDDGSKDLEMSLDMARIYLENGIKKVIATPHYIEFDEESLERNRLALEKLKRALKENNLDLEVFLGNEIYISMNILRDIEENRVASLNGSRYVLIEFPMRELPIYVENVLYELQIKGYIPIIAHPERYIAVQDDPNVLLEFINKGALAQLNLPSLEGLYGSKVKETGEILLGHKMIHFVGTDTHTNRRRSPDVKEALRLLNEIVTKEDYNKLTKENAENILENRVFEAGSPLEYKKKKLFGIFNFKRR